MRWQRVAAAAAFCLVSACGGISPEAAANETEAVKAPATAKIPSSGDAKVDSLLAAIASGDEAGVRKRVGDVGYIVATSGIVASEDAFVERILGCRTEAVTQMRAAVNYRIVWACPARGSDETVYYNAAIATSAPFARDREGLSILEFTAGRANPYLGRGVAPPPPTAKAKNGG